MRHTLRKMGRTTFSLKMCSAQHVYINVFVHSRGFPEGSQELFEVFSRGVLWRFRGSQEPFKGDKAKVTRRLGLRVTVLDSGFLPSMT